LVNTVRVLRDGWFTGGLTLNWRRRCEWA